MRFRISFGICFYAVCLAAILLNQSTVVSSSTGDVTSTATSIDPNEELDDPTKWSSEKFVKTLKANLNTLIRTSLPVIGTASSELSPQCMSSIMTLVGGVRKLEEWAFRLIDASGKIPTGILEGTGNTMGSYDECIDVIAVNERNRTNHLFQGQYCLLNLELPHSLYEPQEVVANASGLKNYNTSFLYFLGGQAELLMKRRWNNIGICVPSTCSADDIERTINKLVSSSGILSHVYDCHVKGDPKKFDAENITALCCFAFLLALIIIGTITDVRHHVSELPKSEEANTSSCFLLNKLKVFSVCRSYQKFIKPPRSDNMFSMLTGMRVFTIAWVVLGHAYFMGDDTHFKFLKDTATLLKNQDLPYMTIMNAVVSVDTFFIVSGFLTTYLTWKSMQHSKGRLNPIIFIMKRALRLIPALLLVIGLLIILPLFGDGPLWDSIWGNQIEKCERTWWYNVLFIHNFLDIDDICLWHTWYLTVAMQLHVILYFLLILLYWNLAVGIAANLVLMLASSVAIVLVSLQYNLSASINYDFSAVRYMLSFVQHIYIQTFTHVGPFCVGVLLGVFIIKHPDKKWPPHKWRLLCWVAATIVALLDVYGLGLMDGFPGPYENPFPKMFYAGVHRIVWGVCVSWVIYDCRLYPTSLVNSFLSLNLFYYLDKLTFMTYMLHPLVMTYHHARAREVGNSDTVDLVYLYLGHMIITYPLAFVAHILVEQPLGELSGMLFAGAPKKKQENPDTEMKTNGQA